MNKKLYTTCPFCWESLHKGLEMWKVSWWSHQMETFSAYQALCEGSSPVPVNSRDTLEIDYGDKEDTKSLLPHLNAIKTECDEKWCAQHAASKFVNLKMSNTSSTSIGKPKAWNDIMVMAFKILLRLNHKLNVHTQVIQPLQNVKTKRWACLIGHAVHQNKSNDKTYYGSN